MVSKLGESQARSLASVHNLQTTLSSQNPWKTRSIRDHDNFNVIAPKAQQIDNILVQQEKDLVFIREGVNLIDSKTQKLESDIDEAVSFLNSLNNKQQSISFQI